MERGTGCQNEGRKRNEHDLGKARATKREKKYQFGRSFGFFTNELYAQQRWMKGNVGHFQL